MWGEWDENVSDLKWKAGKREREIKVGKKWVIWRTSVKMGDW